MQAIKKGIGVTAAVQTLPPGRVERGLGKARRVADRRPKR